MTAGPGYHTSLEPLKQPTSAYVANTLQALREKKRVPSYIISRLQLLSNYPAGKDAERKRKARHLALLAALIQLATAGPKLRTFPPRPATVRLLEFSSVLASKLGMILVVITASPG